MSLLYKRPGSPYWYVTKTRESTRTSNRKLAEEYARKALTEKWRSDALGEVSRTWYSLVEDWLDVKDGRASYAQDRRTIERFSELLARREITALADISADVVAYYAKAVKAETTAATANRHLTTIRAMLRRAASKGWITRAPTIENYKIPKVEATWITIEQFNTIVAHLPEWAADMAVMAVQTGMRLSNVAGLKWKWISQDETVITVPAINTKSGRTYTVPLSNKAREVLERCRGRHAVYVFVGKMQSAPGRFANPIMVDVAPVNKRTIAYWWDNARSRAGLPEVRWHDLRHTWASLHTQNGTPDRILAQMGGWASTRMLETYAHLSTAHLQEFADNVNNT
jgi:integrase